MLRVLTTCAGALGDLLVILKVIPAILEKHKIQKVDFLTTPYMKGAAEILQHQPYINKVHLTQKNWNQITSWSCWNAWKMDVDGYFDSTEKNITKNYRQLYHLTLREDPWPWGRSKYYIPDYFINLYDLPKIDPRKPSIFVEQTDEYKQKYGKYVVVHFQSEKLRYDGVSWSKIFLNKMFNDYKIVLIGTSKEYVNKINSFPYCSWKKADGADEFYSRFTFFNRPNVELFMDKSLYEVAKLIDQSEFYIGVLSGPLFIADSLGKKTIGIYFDKSRINGCGLKGKYKYNLLIGPKINDQILDISRGSLI